MSVRVRVAVALVVAAVVPLLGVFAVVGVLWPAAAAEQDRQRLDKEATAIASLLARDCAAVGDRAALVASRLLVRVSVGDPQLTPQQVLAEQAPDVVRRSQEETWTIVVLDAAGDVLASAGPDAETLTAESAALAERACAGGVLGEPAALSVNLPFSNQQGALGAVVVSAPVDAAALTLLAEQVGSDDAVAVLVGGEVVAAGGPGAPATAGGPEDGEDQSDGADGAGRIDWELVATEAADPTTYGQGVIGGRLGARPFALSRSALEGVTVAAVGDERSIIDRELALAFVVTSFGTAVLVWFLSASVTRPLTELAELARRIAAGDDPLTSLPEDAAVEADSDVQGVSAVLGSLARDLRASEADAQRRRGAFLDAFNRFGDALQQTHDRDGLLQTVLQAALLAAEAPMGLALHHDRSSRLSRRELSLRARSRDDGPTQLDDLTRRTLSEVAERALLERGVVELPGTDERGPVLAVPLGSSSRPLGAVVVARDVGAPGYDAVAFEAIGALASNAGTALANIKDHQEVERLSVTDPLTGVNNFRHLSTMLAREMERATRFGHPLGVLMLDIDRFKPVNDTYGHPAGDAVLRELARRVKECVREVDTVARYGGEEFALLLPETDLDGAERLAQRVLVAIRSERFRLPDGTLLPITASMGVAGFPHHGGSATEVMAAADAALYRAKTGGRDRVEVARDEAAAGATSTSGSRAAGLGSPDREVSP